MDFRQAFISLCAFVAALAGTFAIAMAFAPGARMRAFARAGANACLVASACAFGYRASYTARSRVKETREIVQAVNEVTKTNCFELLVYCVIVFGMGTASVGTKCAACAPLVVVATYQTLATAHKVLERDGKGMYTKLGFGRVFKSAEANMELAMALCATMEISLLTVLCLDLLTKERRSFGRVFAYVQFLRSRYHCEDNTVYRIKFTAHNVAFYHREVWSTLDAKLFRRLPAGARGRLAFVTRWFTMTQ